MYLGYREWDKEKCKNVFVVCLEGTQEDIRRVKTTSKYFNQTKFESFTLGMLKSQNLIPVSKSGKEITNSFILNKEDFE